MRDEFVYVNKKPYLGDLPLRAVFYGEGVFETFRCRGFSLPPYFDRHLSRMEGGAEALGIPYPGDETVIDAIIHALEVSDIDDAYVKSLLLSTGPYVFHSHPESASIMIVSKDYTPPKEPVKAHVSPFRRNSTSPLVTIKSLNYLESILAKREAAAKGFDDSIFLNERGFVTEATAGNIFWINDDEVFTPSKDCGLLPGVMRSIVLEATTDLKIRISEGEYSLEDLIGAHSAFLTSSLGSMVSISSIDGRDFDLSDELYIRIKEEIIKKIGWF